MSNESSINRIVHWLNIHSVAMLTSDRNQLTNIHIHSGDKPNENIYTRTLVDIPLNSKYTSNQKLNRRNTLKAYLLKKGFGS
jgi:general stress protein 26